MELYRNESPYDGEETSTLGDVFSEKLTEDCKEDYKKLFDIVGEKMEGNLKEVVYFSSESPEPGEYFLTTFLSAYADTLEGERVEGADLHMEESVKVCNTEKENAVPINDFQGRKWIYRKYLIEICIPGMSDYLLIETLEGINS